MAPNVPRKHHYVPKFFLRNFSSDEAKNRITTVAKHGNLAVWKERSIESIAYDHDFYVHSAGGAPVSIETDLNRHFENPISQSETWHKIANNRSDTLDRSDKGILYALIRHLENRTPHYLATQIELAELAGDTNSTIPFTEEEREYFAILRSNPVLSKSMFNQRLLMPSWSPDAFHSCLISILRSPIPLRSSTAPSMAMKIHADPRISLPLPGMTPYQLMLTINPTTIACLVLGDFDGGFVNQCIDEQTARAINRHFVGHFCNFGNIRHLISNRDNLAEDMTWAPYDLIKQSHQQMTFRRRS